MDKSAADEKEDEPLANGGERRLFDRDRPQAAISMPKTAWLLNRG